uniref:AT27059p n=1 Tax=Drosophila melanogaster TaxID=7227 RepID=Q8IH95_DROME|nr:AT27059p [Drosophila melanogaster]
MPHTDDTFPEGSSCCPIDIVSSNKVILRGYASKANKDVEVVEELEEIQEMNDELRDLFINTTAINCSSLSELKIQTDAFNTLKERTLFSLGYSTAGLLKKSKISKVLKGKVNLYQQIVSLVKQRTKTNSEITIGKTSHPVHLMVLQSFSRMFRDMGNDLSVALPEKMITPRSFGLIYEWMIEDTPVLPRLGLLEVFHAAKFMEIPQLVRQCKYCLDHGFTEDSAAMLYFEAKILKLEVIHLQYLERVSKFFLTLVASKEFLRLPLKSMLLLIQSDLIGVNTELEVFMAAARWLSHHWPQREENVTDVVSSIRFGLIPPWLLIRLQKPDVTSVGVGRIVAQPIVRQAIHEGIAYTTTRMFYGKDREAFKHYLHKACVKPPVQRTWIYDRKCPYHHRMQCRNTVDLTYDAFLEYLNYTQRQHRDYWKSLEPVDASNVCFSCQAKKSDLTKPNS